MRTTLTSVLSAGLIAAVTATCARSGPEPPSPAAPCRPADDEAGLIAQRLTNGATELHGARAVRLEPPVGQYAFVVAAEVQGEVGVWGVGPWLGGARVIGIDAVARRWSTWGTTLPDASPTGRQRSELASRPEVAMARACV